MCKVLQVSSGSYYRWKKQTITARELQKIAIKKQIILIYFESKQRYGSPRIALKHRSIDYKIARPERQPLYLYNKLFVNL